MSLFAVPMAVARPREQRLATLPAELEAHAEALRGRPDTGLDWVFPWLYAKSTRSFVATLEAGPPVDPAFLRAWTGQFYEVYARNSARWLAGAPCEPAWARTAALSRSLAAAPGSGPEHRGAALVQALATVYVHVVVDLPRALLVTHRRVSGPRGLRASHRAYFGLTRCFAPVIEDLVLEARITPTLLARAWPSLPEPARSALAGGPLGLATYLRLLRRVARLRFHRLRLDRAIRAEIAGYPVSDTLTGLTAP